MSCLLDHVIAINNLEEQINWICPSLDDKQQNRLALNNQDVDETEWTSDWDDWEGEQSTSPGGSQMSQSWVSECKMAVSPTVDYFVLGYKNRLLILANRWESKVQGDEGCMKLVQNWRGAVGQTDTDEISCLLCLPLISQKQSSTGAADWTCIIVGFTSGYVSMYTENGMLLLTQMFDVGCVLNLKCRTMISGVSHSIYDLSEELVVLYEQSITTIDGFSLSQTLRGCRSQLAKAAASGGENVNVPPLGYKKWGLVNHQLVTDVVPVGMAPPYMYDHLAQLTLSKGIGQMPPPGVPTTCRYVTVGKIPYMGFLCAKETGVQPFMADVAMHYASKIKNAIVSVASGWIFGSRKTEEVDKKDQPKIEAATPLPFASSIPDKRRTGLSLQLSPDKRLAAATDDFGRVVLVDVAKNITIRMWKGYREAECGWLEVDGDYKGTKRRTSFLLIYAPRRGILEVWLPQQGPRIAAFNVPKQGKLLNTSHTLLGINTVRKVECKMYSVLFVTPEGSLLEVSIPFHLALGSKTSKKARDLHLLKSLKGWLREGKDDEVMIAITEMKTSNVRTQAVAAVIASNHLSASLLQALINHLSSIYESVDDKECNLDHEGKILKQQVKRLSQLLQFHNTISSLHTSTHKTTSHDSTFILQKLSERLMLTPEETENILPIGIKNMFSQNENKRRVKFDTPAPLNIGSFVRSWDSFTGNIVKDQTNTIPVHLRTDLSSDKSSSVGKFLFSWQWSTDNVDTFSKALKASGVECKGLLLLCLKHWSHEEEVNLLSTLHLSSIIHVLSLIMEKDIIRPEDEVSKIWKDVRDLLITWTRVGHAYLAALICRGIHASLVSTAEGGAEDVGTNFSLMEWEGLSMEMVEWNLIINKLDKLLPLEAALNYHNESGAVNNLHTSIKLLLDRGKGFVSEVVAQWLLSSGVPIDTIIEIVHGLDQGKKKMSPEEEDMDITMPEEEEEQKDSNVLVFNKEKESPPDQYSNVKELLREVQSKFPESLESDTIITNMAWEVGANWSKNSVDIDKFSWAVTLLQGVKNCYLRHGLGVMMWNTWVEGQIQTLRQLLDKVGRAPKDRICRKELGFGEHSLSSYLQSVLSLLDIIMEANVVCEVDKPSSLSTDDFWRNVEVSPALIDLTLVQNMSCYDLIMLHHQLVTVLHIAIRYSVRNVKPLSYFDLKARGMMFEPLHTNFTLSPMSIPSIKKGREAFLSRAISAVVLNLPDNLPIQQFTMVPLREILDLARAWGTNMDHLHRHHVCQLYSSGHDHLAESVLPMVNDTHTLGSQLVMIAGQRLSYVLGTCPNRPDTIVLVSPILLQWVQSQDHSNIKFSLDGKSYAATTSMVNFALNFLNDETHEKKMAFALHGTFEALQRTCPQEDI